MPKKSEAKTPPKADSEPSVLARSQEIYIVIDCEGFILAAFDRWEKAVASLQLTYSGHGGVVRTVKNDGGIPWSETWRNHEKNQNNKIQKVLLFSKVEHL